MSLRLRFLLRLSEEYRCDVPGVKIFCHIAGDDCFVCFEQIEIAAAHFRCDFESHMQELTKAAVVCGGLRIVPKRGRVLFGRPERHCVWQGQFCGMDINDGGVGRAKLFAVFVSLCVDLLCQCETIAARCGEADELFEPRGACGLEMDACVKLANRVVDGCVDRKLVAAG